jgi:DNA-binding CsgD family transcriptional regulator
VRDNQGADGSVRASQLLGREPECRLLSTGLERARSGSASRIWVEGEPGSGKTSLASWAQSVADGFAQVATCCVEGESTLSLATVLTVARALRRFVDRVPAGYRAPLQSLLGETAGPNSDPFRLGVAMLDLVSAAAEERPVLVVLDDWHWVDAESALVLDFAFRRLDSDAVAVVTTSRRPPADPESGRQEVIRISGLGTGAATELLHQTGPYAPEVAQSIVRETAGLPLALLEVGAELTPGQRLGEAPLPNPLPVGDRILAEYRSRLSTLPAGPKLAVGVVAAAGSDISAVAPGLALLGLPSDVLDEAETAGVVNTTVAGPTFRHPLLRTAALSELTGSQRRRAEWALANTVEDAERRASHLVRSAEGPSEEMAERLEAAAEIVVSRMGSLAAASIWADAARLTPDGPERLARLRRAAGELAAAGRLPEAQSYIAQILASTDDLATRAEAVTWLTWTRLWTDPATAASDALAEAARFDSEADDHARRLRSVASLCFVILGDFRRAATLVPDTPEPALHSLLPNLEAIAPANVLASSGRVKEANSWLPPDRVRQCMRIARQNSTDIALLTGVQLAALTLILVERFDEAGSLVETAISGARRAGRPQNLPFLLALDAELAWRSSEWSRLEAHLTEALSLAADTGEHGFADIICALLGRLSAVRGDHEGSATYLFAPGSQISGSGGVAQFYRLGALGLFHLGAGNLGTAAAVLAELDALTTHAGVENAVAVPYHGDFIEALAGTDEKERAREVIGRMFDHADDTGLVWPRSIAFRGMGLLSGDADADGHFSASLECWPQGFEGARTRLAWAESLLRRHVQSDGSRQLAEASRTFERLGARPWADRARALQDEYGAAQGRRLAEPLADLTAQELKVALQVAEGNTNREAGAQLFISAKTVEHHLSAVYAKLGIRSRSELVRIVATSTNRAPPAPPAP